MTDLYKKTKQQLDELEKQLADNIEKDILYKLIKKDYDLKIDEIVERMFFDTIMEYYADVADSVRLRKVKISNLPKKENYQEDDSSSENLYTTYNKVKKKYIKLFRDNTSFFDSEAEKEISKKLFRKRIPKTDFAPMLFVIYMINKLYGYCCINGYISLFEERFSKYLSVDKLMYQLDRMFGEIVEDEPHYWFIKFAGEFFRDFNKNDVLIKFDFKEYCMLLRHTKNLLFELHCAYTGVFIGDTLKHCHRVRIEETLKDVKRKDIKLKQATDSVLKRIKTLERTNSCIDKEEMKKDFDRQINEYKEITSGKRDILVKGIEKYVYKKTAHIYSERIKRKLSKDIKKYDDNLTIEQLEQMRDTIDMVSFRCPEDLKDFLKSLRNDAVSLIKESDEYAIICANIFRKSYILCKEIDKNKEVPYYPCKQIMECLSDILYSKVSYVDREYYMIDVIEDNMYAAYRLIIRRGLDSIYRNIHMTFFAIKNIANTIVDGMEKDVIYPTVFKLIARSISKQQQLFYRQISKMFEINLTKESCLDFIEKYIRENSILEKSNSCLSDFYNLDEREDYYLERLQYAF